jgi:ketosteroid isomerase-like protein
MTNRSSDEQEVRERIEAWALAVRSHDLEGVIAHHVEDVVYFDVPVPPEVRGIDGYARSWPPFFHYIGKTGQFELTELEISAGTDVAFAHAIILVRGATETKASPIRLTVGLVKLRGEWKVAHEHHSAPFESNETGS